MEQLKVAVAAGYSCDMNLSQDSCEVTANIKESVQDETFEMVPVHATLEGELDLPL